MSFENEFIYVKECNGAVPAVDGGQPNILVKMIKNIRKIYIKNETLINTFSLKHLLNLYNCEIKLEKNLYDPSIGQESLTTVDVVGVLVGHILFGVVAALLIDWSWIPLSPQQRESGRSLKEIKRSWGWDEENEKKDESLSPENRKF